MGEGTEITFDVGYRDYRRLHAHMNKRWYWPRLFDLVVGLIVAGMVAWPALRDATPAERWIMCAGVVVLWFGVSWSIGALYTWLAMRKADAATKHYSARLTPEALEYGFAGTSHTIPWEAFATLESRPDAIYMSGSFYFFRVPMHAFQNTDDAARFFDQARAYWIQARSGA